MNLTRQTVIDMHAYLTNSRLSLYDPKLTFSPDGKVVLTFQIEGMPVTYREVVPTWAGEREYWEVVRSMTTEAEEAFA